MSDINFLTNIITEKRKRVASKRGFYDAIKQRLTACTYAEYRVFRQAISKTGQINLIAELKKASPSKGLIREDFDLLGLAKTYEQHGAAAISVLTEEQYFLGKPQYIRKVADEIHLPILAKDFIVDEGQIYEARLNGASAVLLIVAILENTEIKSFQKIARRLDVDCLVEVHNQEELDRALVCEADIIGINNRNLNTLEVSLDQGLRLIPQIPKDKVIVAESGVQTADDVMRLKEAGAHAVLIGETFMAADDVGAKVKEIMG